MVLATPFSLLGFSVISDILFIVFVISGILLFFNVKFKFIDYILNKHETLSYYLCSFGWVPYFIAVMFLLLVCTHVIFGYEQEFLQWSAFFYLRLWHFLRKNAESKMRF